MTLTDTLSDGSAGIALRPELTYAEVGASVSPAGDINGDGFADVVVGAPKHNLTQGRAYVVFGTASTDDIFLADIADGTGGFVIDSPGAYRYIGNRLSAGGDMNGDGIPDIALASLNGASFGEPSIYVVFGKGDTTAVALEDVATATGGFGITSDVPYNAFTVSMGDMTGDGLADLNFAGFPSYPADGPVTGYVVFGNTAGDNVTASEIEDGTAGFTLVGEPSSGVNGGILTSGTMEFAGDMNGDGIGDFFCSTSGNESLDQSTGRSYMVFGADFLGTTTGLGSPDDDLIFANLGADEADYLVGEHGADSLFSDGGPDVTLGGSGDDIITIVDDAFRRIHGGSGTDTVALGATDLSLDLTAINGWRLTEIERFDLTGNGSNSLTLTLPVVSGLSPWSNEITVVGESDDELVLDVSTAEMSQAGGFTTYTFNSANGGALLVTVSDDVAVSAPPAT